MKYYYAENGAFIEANNENRMPQGAKAFTYAKPEHGGMFYDVINSQWVDGLEEL